MADQPSSSSALPARRPRGLRLWRSTSSERMEAIAQIHKEAIAHTSDIYRYAQFTGLTTILPTTVAIDAALAKGLISTDDADRLDELTCELLTRLSSISNQGADEIVEAASRVIW